MRTLAAATGLLMIAVAADAAPAFEVRLVVPCTPETQTYSLVATGEQLCLSTQYLIGNAAVVRARRGPGDDVVDVEITPVAFEELHDASVDDPDARVGILFDDRLIDAPLIGRPLKKQSLELDLENDPDDADALVSAFPGTQATK